MRTLARRALLRLIGRNKTSLFFAPAPESDSDFRREPEIQIITNLVFLLVSHEPQGDDTNMLNDTRVRNAKRADRPIKLSDSGGLHLLIQPNGSKLWRLAYRFGGKQKTLAIGVYPTVTLKHAREKRDEAKRLLADNIDPSTQRRLEKLMAATGNTFRAVAEEVLVKLEREGRADVTLAKKRWLLDFAYPAIGERPVAEITAPEVLAILRKVEALARYETERRLRSTCGMVFRYAIATGRAERDPSVDLRGALTAPRVIHRAAIVDPAGIGALLRAIEDYDGLPLTKAALKLAPLVFVRPGELRKAEWVEFDLEHAEWRIPAEKMKMRRLHRVPLSKQALAIIRELQTFSRASSANTATLVKHKISDAKMLVRNIDTAPNQSQHPRRCKCAWTKRHIP
jgi:integrase